MTKTLSPSIPPLPHCQTGKHCRWLLVLFLTALCLRAGWGTFRIVQADNPNAAEFPDERQYWSMAKGLHAGEGLKDELGFRATRMPLYPAALSCLAGLSNGMIFARAVQWVLGAAAAVLTAGLAGALFDRRVGLLAGFLVAFDPFLLFFSSLLLTETLFVTAFVGLAWLMAPVIRAGVGTPSRWVCIGLTAAVVVYLRESSVGLIALMLGFAVVRHRFDRRALAGAVLAALIVVAALIPWAARNQQVIGEWCWLTTRSGISLYDGVGPTATGESDLGWIKQMPAVEGLSEVEWNRYFLRESFAAIRSDPVRIVRLAGVKIARMWNPIPNVETYRSSLMCLVSALWMLPTLLGAAIGAYLMFARRADHGVHIALFLLLPAFFLTLLHGLFIGSVRYRLGAIPMLEILAAFALVTIIQGLRNGKAARGNGVVD